MRKFSGPAAAHLPHAGAYRNRPDARAAELPFDRNALIARELRHYENAYHRHRLFVTEYRSRYAAAPAAAAAAPSEYDIAHDHSRFIWKDDERGASLLWEERVARNYYDRLFKEYAIADLSQFESGRIGLRWRTEAEVMDGKGQFVCGNRRCVEVLGLCSYEVNFSYEERGQARTALVKLRVCPPCAQKLNHRSEHAKAARPRLLSPPPPASNKRRRRDEPASPVPAEPTSPKEADVGGGKSREDGHAARPDPSRAAELGSDADIWRKQPEPELTRGDEFAAYLSEMLL
jgi:hypothetical protein